MKGSVLSLLCVCLLIKAVVGRTKKEVLYNYEKKGYLYNVEYNKFMAYGDIHEGYSFLKISSDPTEIALMSLKPVFYDNAAFTVILLERASVTSQGNGIYPNHLSAGLGSGDWRHRFIQINGDNTDETHRFSITGAVERHSEAFMMRLGDGCLSVESKRNAVKEECLPATSKERKRQHWIFIDQERYIKDMKRGKHPKYTGIKPARSHEDGEENSTEGGFKHHDPENESYSRRYPEDRGFGGESSDGGESNDSANPQHGGGRYGCCRRRRRMCSYCDYFDNPE